MQIQQLAPRRSLNAGRQFPRCLTPEHPLGFNVREGFNHTWIVSRHDTICQAGRITHRAPTVRRKPGEIDRRRIPIERASNRRRLVSCHVRRETTGPAFHLAGFVFAFVAGRC